MTTPENPRESPSGHSAHARSLPADSPCPGGVLYDWPDGGVEEDLHLPARIPDDAEPCDIAIIGAGLLGAALAWRLSQFQLHVVLIDARHAVGEGAARTCPGVLRTGYDAPPGSDESHLLAAGRNLWPGLARDLKIPSRRAGALLLAPRRGRARLDEILQNARMNGVEDARLVTEDEAREIEPALATRTGDALFVPRESLIDPFAATTAFAETALRNGADLVLGFKVVRIDNVAGPVKFLVSPRGCRIPTRAIVNVAGAGARHLADVCGGESFPNSSRRRQFLVLDPCGEPPVRRILASGDNAQTAAPRIYPTLCDRVLIGPHTDGGRLAAHELDATSREALEGLRGFAAELAPALAPLPALRAFAGAAVHTPEESVHLRFEDGAPGLVCATGHGADDPAAIPALVERLVEGLHEHMRLALDPLPGARRGRDSADWPVWWRRPLGPRSEGAPVEAEDARVVCQCQSISRGEIRRVLDSPLQPRTLDAVKRMTRVLMGPCQGNECLLQIAEILSEHTGVAQEKITLRGPGTEIFGAGNVP